MTHYDPTPVIFLFTMMMPECLLQVFATGLGIMHHKTDQSSGRRFVRKGRDAFLFCSKMRPQAYPSWQVPPS